MKEKVFIFIIGLLVGAILATGVFYVYYKSNTNNSGNQTMQMNGGQPPELPSGQTGEPPEKPNGEEPPEKPSENNTQTNNE